MLICWDVNLWLMVKYGLILRENISYWEQWLELFCYDIFVGQGGEEDLNITSMTS